MATHSTDGVLGGAPPKESSPLTPESVTFLETESADVTELQRGRAGSWGASNTTGVLIRGRFGHRHSQEEGSHVKAEAESRATCLRTKGSPGLLATTRS